MEMSGRRQHSKTLKRRRWGGLRQQWQLLGLFQIDEQHEFYPLTCMMKEGLATAVQSTSQHVPTLEGGVSLSISMKNVPKYGFNFLLQWDYAVDFLPPENFRSTLKEQDVADDGVVVVHHSFSTIKEAELSEEDYKSEVTHIHKDFTMETFAGPVFASLRSSLGMTEQEYQQSLCSEHCYLQFISNSKSRADFFLTNDKRFFLKTQNRREINFLLSNLKIYVNHLKKFPHSLLVKFLGVHRITLPQRQKKFFIVMQSVFYPDDRINARYDIKGCEVSRWTDPAPEESHIIVVLKDLNFEGQFITLDQQRSWLLRQVELDTQFLQRLNVLDYSLLLAHQPLHWDERHQGHSFANIIIRTKRSVIPSYSPKHPVASVPGEVLEEDSSVIVSENVKGLTEDASGAEKMNAFPECTVSCTDPNDLLDYQAQNRRLLPNLKNPLHVIDGPEQRYFIGIIDIFTVYSFKKRLEHWWKRLRHPGKSFSTVSPNTYCLRLQRWVQDHTK